MKIATISNDSRVVSFAWTDGKESEFDSKKVPAEMVAEYLCLGISTKLQNSYAGAKSKGMGVADCRAAAEDLWSRVLGGDWGAERFGGIWCEAIARVQNRDVAEISKLWAKFSDEKKSAVKKHPKIAAAKLDIERERLDARDDGDSDDSILEDFE